MSLTQAEADYLMQSEKNFTSDDPLILGLGPLKCVRTLISGDRILNDEERKPSGDLLRAFRTWQIQPVLWSQRERYGDALQF